MQPPAGAEGAESAAPRADSPLGQWLRGTMETLGRVVHKIDELTDPKTGLVPDEVLAGDEFKSLREVAESEQNLLIVEIRAWVDNAVALIATRRPMSELLVAAKGSGGGADDALLLALQIDPQLISLDGIDARVQDKVRNRDGRFLRRLARALSSGPRLQKNAVIGFIVATLWEAGLKRLTSPEIRGFLKAAGFLGVPPPQALERHIQRLGLKKYSIG